MAVLGDFFFLLILLSVTCKDFLQRENARLVPIPVSLQCPEEPGKSWWGFFSLFSFFFSFSFFLFFSLFLFFFFCFFSARFLFIFSSVSEVLLDFFFLKETGQWKN